MGNLGKGGCCVVKHGGSGTKANIKNGWSLIENAAPNDRFPLMYKYKVHGTLICVRVVFIPSPLYPASNRPLLNKRPVLFGLIRRCCRRTLWTVVAAFQSGRPPTPCCRPSAPANCIPIRIGGGYSLPRSIVSRMFSFFSRVLRTVAHAPACAFFLPGPTTIV